MSNRKLFLNISLSLTLLLAVPVASADMVDKMKRHTGSGDPVAGKVKSQMCQGCHGVDGNATDTQIPKLAGQYDDYIMKQMHNYLTGVRSHEIMNGMAAPLSDKDLNDISAYFSSQSIMRGDGMKGSSKSIERGQALFTKGNLAEKVMTCLYCHGENGKGLDSSTGMYPVIGGQNKAYLLKQLKDFRADDRANSPNAVMNMTLKALDDSDLEALADYLSAQ